MVEPWVHAQAAPMFLSSQYTETGAGLQAALTVEWPYWDCIGILLGFYWGSIGVLLGFYWDSIGILLEFYWGSIGVGVECGVGFGADKIFP